jgi:GTP cyclohydrolase I
MSDYLTARGVRDTNSVMQVNVIHGVFQKDQNARAEMLMRVGRR